MGALVAGHAHPEVLASVAAAAARGTSFGAPTALEVELAEEVARRVPGAEMLRMTSSGTEAAMTAIRLARAYTGREVVIKFAGAYHGHSDGLLAQAGSGLATQGIPASPGVPAATAAATVVVPWNDADALEQATERHAVAAIIAEPYPANMGLIAPVDGFLALLRERADACGALLILDEVISGFRVAPGGASERSGVTGDLVVLGKILGGGLPAAAVAGSRELLETLAPVGEVYQAGTLSGNPLAVAAGLATLALLDEAAYASLTAATQRLAEGLRAAAGGRAVSVAWVPGLLTVFFADRAAAGPRGRQALRPGRLRRVVPRAAGARRLSAAVAVRGVVPVAGPRGRADRAHAGRRAGGIRRAAGERGGRMSTLERLRDLVAAEGEPLAAGLLEHPSADAEPTLGAIAAAGPRASANPGEYELLIEAIYEGYLLHYGVSRLLSGERRRSGPAGRRPPLHARPRAARRARRPRRGARARRRDRALRAAGRSRRARQLRAAVACRCACRRLGGRRALPPRQGVGASGRRERPRSAARARSAPCHGMTIFFALARFPRSVIGTHAQAQQVQVHR